MTRGPRHADQDPLPLGVRGKRRGAHAAAVEHLITAMRREGVAVDAMLARGARTAAMVLDQAVAADLGPGYAMTTAQADYGRWWERLNQARGVTGTRDPFDTFLRDLTADDLPSEVRHPEGP